MIIISCSNEKLQTGKPIQAKNLYIGSLFLQVWNKAVTLDPDVFILSAGYGLVKPNDLLLPYERKMTGRIALHISKITNPIPNAWHFLPFLYAKAVPWASPALPARLSIGKFLQAISNIPDGQFRYIERGDGELRKMLPLNELKQEHRGRNGSCKAICDALLDRAMDVHEICEFLEDQFGPPVGVSYMPTVRTQLRVLPRRYNLKVTNEDGKFRFFK